LSGVLTIDIVTGSQRRRRPAKLSSRGPDAAPTNFFRRGKMALLSRAFLRRRVVSLATTLTLSASSMAAAQNHLTAPHVAGTVRMQMTANRPDTAAEAPFLAENEIAMTKMMTDMTVKPTGDVDRDFVEMMVPHHQGAIEMAQAVLRHGHNEQLRRLAQEIIVTQQQEIAAMRLALGEPLPASAASPTQPHPAQPVADDARASRANAPPTSGDPIAHNSMNMK
jgi:hypothetical protein